jgi:hypothetical protein
MFHNALQPIKFVLEGYKIHLDFIYLWIAFIVMCPQFWGNLDPSCSNDKQFARSLVKSHNYFRIFIIPFHTWYSNAKNVFLFQNNTFSNSSFGCQSIILFSNNHLGNKRNNLGKFYSKWKQLLWEVPWAFGWTSTLLW